jgi:hypothetical protein
VLEVRGILQVHVHTPLLAAGALRFTGRFQLSGAKNSVNFELSRG